MNGPISIDPNKLDEARAAYQNTLAKDRPELIDADGRSHAQDPFDINPDGTTTFNRWKNASNQSGAQNTFFTDTVKGRSGPDTVRRAAWQAVPTFYNNSGREQFDSISKQLNALQGSGFASMQSIYKNALSNLK